MKFEPLPALEGLNRRLGMHGLPADEEPFRRHDLSIPPTDRSHAGGSATRQLWRNIQVQSAEGGEHPLGCCLLQAQRRVGVQDAGSAGLGTHHLERLRSVPPRSVGSPAATSTIARPAESSISYSRTSFANRSRPASPRCGGGREVAGDKRHGVFLFHGPSYPKNETILPVFNICEPAPVPKRRIGIFLPAPRCSAG